MELSICKTKESRGCTAVHRWANTTVCLRSIDDAALFSCVYTLCTNIYLHKKRQKHLLKIKIFNSKYFGKNCGEEMLRHMSEVSGLNYSQSKNKWVFQYVSWEKICSQTTVCPLHQLSTAIWQLSIQQTIAFKYYSFDKDFKQLQFGHTKKHSSL